MGEYSMTQLSMKQCLIETHIKRMKKLNHLLAEMVVNDMDKAVMNAIQDICSNIAECAADIKNAGESISSYAFMAGQELKKEEQVKNTKTLNVTLDAWDKSREDNAAALAEGKLPVINNVDDVDPYVTKVGEAGQNG